MKAAPSPDAELELGCGAGAGAGAGAARDHELYARAPAPAPTPAPAPAPADRLSLDTSTPPPQDHTEDENGASPDADADATPHSVHSMATRMGARQGPRPSMISAKYRLKEERRRVLKMSVSKLRTIEDPESALRRSVLINNTMRRLQREANAARIEKLNSRQQQKSAFNESLSMSMSLSMCLSDSLSAPVPAPAPAPETVPSLHLNLRQEQEQDSMDYPMEMDIPIDMSMDEPSAAAAAVACASMASTRAGGDADADADAEVESPPPASLALEELEDVLSQFYMPPTPRMITSIDEDEAIDVETVSAPQTPCTRVGSATGAPPRKRARLGSSSMGLDEEARQEQEHALADPTNMLEDFRDEVYLRCSSSSSSGKSHEHIAGMLGLNDALPTAPLSEGPSREPPRTPLATANASPSSPPCDEDAALCGAHRRHTGHDRENIAPSPSPSPSPSPPPSPPSSAGTSTSSPSSPYSHSHSHLSVSSALGSLGSLDSHSPVAPLPLQLQPYSLQHSYGCGQSSMLGQLGQLQLGAPRGGPMACGPCGPSVVFHGLMASMES